ncbi:hypothetical protein, partial [Actinocorallia longicatena]|uniref:hypothetical protein n=1 Tax=Actinocorallia longicatena TaxID=111803 RepID=UPI0031DA605B
MRISRGRECGRDATELADELAAIISIPDMEPLAVPVRWETTTRPVVDVSSGLVMTPQRRAFAGVDDDRTVQRITGQFRAIPAKRTVIIGEPGSGRTSMARMLARGLLAARRPGRAVPVLLPLDGWDPVTESLPGWIVGTLAGRCYRGRRDVPQRLLESELLLPVLDGLDAIPERIRARAVLELDRLIGTARPVVLTCRPADFTGLLRDGCPTLHDTPVFTLLPVVPGDLAPFPELEQLHDRLGGPVGQALSTPLFVAVARRVPSRLGEVRDLATRLQVESRLLEAFVAELTALAPPARRRGRNAPEPPELAHLRVREWLAGSAPPARRRRGPPLAGLRA